MFAIINVKIFLMLTLLMPCISLSQNFEKDTIQLKEVRIESKKAKLKTIQFGKGKGAGALMNNPEYIYVIESIPEGYIQEITIHFNNFRMRDYLYTIDGKDGFTKKTVEKTEFEITLYGINDQNMLGRKINEEPFLVSLEESKDFYPKKTIDLSGYNFYTKRFFICIKRISTLPCEDCYFYLPAQKSSDKKLWFHGDKNTIKLDDNIQKKDKYGKLNYCLRCEVKTLTREY